MILAEQRRDDDGKGDGALAAIGGIARRATRRLIAILRSPFGRSKSRRAQELLERSQANLEELERFAGSSVIVSGHSTGPTLDLLIRMAETQGMTGRLWIRTDHDLLAFDIRDRHIVGSLDDSGSLEGERTGDILIGMGALDTAQLAHALTVAQHLQIPVGVAALHEKLVTAEQLEEAIRQQCILRLSRAIFAEGAAYALATADKYAVNFEHSVAINPRELITACSQGCPTMASTETLGDDEDP